MRAAGCLLTWLRIGCRPTDTDAKGLMHRVDYDDPQSLKLKYGYAKQAKALGVGMWTATAINCEDLCSVRLVRAPNVLIVLLQTPIRKTSAPSGTTSRRSRRPRPRLSTRSAQRVCGMLCSFVPCPLS